MKTILHYKQMYIEKNVQAMAGLEDNPDFHHYFFFLWLNMMLYGLKLPFCEFNSICNPSQPSSHSLQSQWEESLMLCKHCSVTAKTLVWYQHYFSHKCKTKHLMRKANPAHTSCLDCSNGNYDGEGFGAKFIEGFHRNKLKFVEKI